MAKEDNLIPFDSQRGKAAGKKSSRKGIPNTKTRLKRFLQLIDKQHNPVTGKDEEMTVAEQMDLAIIARARKGDIRAYNALIDRLEGKPHQAIEHSGSENSIKLILAKYGYKEGEQLDELPESAESTSEDTT